MAQNNGIFPLFVFRYLDLALYKNITKQSTLHPTTSAKKVINKSVVGCVRTLMSVRRNPIIVASWQIVLMWKHLSIVHVIQATLVMVSTV